MNAETIQAAGAVIVALLGAWQARTASQVKDLTDRLRAVEGQRDEFKHLFRAAVRHIREWMTWATNHAPGAPAPPVPQELRDEV
ncbi:hypothetical protein [Mycobacterium sp. SMC-11]|uniref:hypothetical protein n=1 Tax=Mycobacterium sp. SMC-11 TaxID=3385969 RepID=UPI00390C42F5